MPIANVASVLAHGILSHAKAARLQHTDVSMADVQERRARKSVPAGLPLHEYANLYFCARNPMLYLRQNEHSQLCVLRVNRQVLNLPNVVLTTGNAAAKYSRFLALSDGLREIMFDDVFADYWTDEDYFVQMRKKSAKCAEVLVPHCIDSHFILGAYVSNATARDNLLATGFSLPITLNANMFFA